MADRFTIIPGDGTVVVNGVARTGLAFTLDPEIHAVQGFEDGRIVVEYREVPFRSQMLKPQNETTTVVAPFQPALDAWAAASES